MNLTEKLQFDSEMELTNLSTNCGQYDTNNFLIHFNIENHDKVIETFAYSIQNLIEQFCIIENKFNNQPIAATKNQLNLILVYIKYYSEKSKSYNNSAISTSEETQINGFKDISLFEVLLSICLAIITNKSSVNLFCDNVRQKIFEDLLNGQFINVSVKTQQSKYPVQPPAYGCQIIFDTADINSAFAELGMAWQDNTAPWRIRTCWIQESIKDKFFAEIQSCIKPCDNYFENYQEDILNSVQKSQVLGATVIQTTNKRSPALVCGLSQKNINCDHLIFVNFFRTTKDLITLVNADKNAICSSIWTENISIAYEVANKIALLNVWINSNGILNPTVPLTICDQIFGSELSIIKFGILANSNSNSSIANYKLWLKDLYSSSNVIGQYMFNCISVSKKTQLFIGDLKVNSEERIMNLLANLLLYNQKMICIPFSSTYAN